jgi:serine/threonine protein kinase
MTNCPYCDALLPAIVSVNRTCPACQRLLGDARETFRTIRLDQTHSPITAPLAAPATQFSLAPEFASPNDFGVPGDSPLYSPPAAPLAGVELALNARDFADAEHAPTHPDYRLGEKLGAGGMGVVWEARQTALGREVAVKFLNAGGEKDFFMREAKLTGAMEHPNVVPVYDFGVNSDGQLFYAMRRISGMTWAAQLEKKSLLENIQILLQLCDAVAYAHYRGIIHRDLKPENVLLGEFGEVILTDWGLAAGIWDGAPAPRVTYADAVAGTPAYMAPEMAKGEEDKIDALSDIYLLGAILFEIITGKQPHNGKNVDECLTNAAANIIVEAWVDSPLLRTAKKAMHTERDERFASVKQLKEVISQLAESVEAATRGGKARAEALAHRDYFAFFRAIGEYSHAIEVFAENTAAQRALRELTEKFATLAEENGDLYLSRLLRNNQDNFATATRQRSAAESGKRTAP